MDTLEHEQLKSKYFNEAIRYMDNAKETLKKAGKDGNHYKDAKYVKTACGTAYNGVLVALDGYFLLKGVEKRKGRKSIDFYQQNVAKLDKKLLADLHDVYSVLHLSGYYDGVTSVSIIREGFEIANNIIQRINPN